MIDVWGNTQKGKKKKKEAMGNIFLWLGLRLNGPTNKREQRHSLLVEDQRSSGQEPCIDWYNTRINSTNGKQFSWRCFQVKGSDCKPNCWEAT